jgi:hypothetical protein
MLFNYVYQPHELDRLQEWLDDLFLNTWCSASEPFDVQLLNDPWRSVVLDIFNSATTKDYLYGPIERVYNIFLTIDRPTRDVLRQAYLDNNNIEGIYANAGNCNAYSYRNIQAINASLAVELKRFYMNLYENVLKLKTIKDKLGDLNDRYRDFMGICKKERKDKCAFCGLVELLGADHSKREAYDHIVSKGEYPFNSVNFRNLVPMCGNCNSKYKLAKDPITRKDGTRRRAFYAYGTRNVGLHFSLSINNKDLMNLKTEDITLNIDDTGMEEEIESWLDVFGIEERYKAALVGGDAQYWHDQTKDEVFNAMNMQGGPASKDEWIQFQLNSARTNLLAEKNFLKVPFIEECVRIQNET